MAMSAAQGPECLPQAGADRRADELWEVRQLLSVANLGRQDGLDFLGQVAHPLTRFDPALG